MKRKRMLIFSALALILVSLRSPGQGVLADRLSESGQIVVGGHATPYLIRHLPVSSFPQIPAAVRSQLDQRGCLIPQTYQARGPENVVQASLERRGSEDWAVLCSHHGTVSLLVFFADGAAPPTVLASAQETERLQANAATGVLGFDWALDAATPEQVRQAQTGMRRRPALLDHDALAESVIDQTTVYHYYTGDTWIVISTQD
jgi:hypothetical protein